MELSAGQQIDKWSDVEQIDQAVAVDVGFRYVGSRGDGVDEWGHIKQVDHPVPVDVAQNNASVVTSAGPEPARYGKTAAGHGRARIILADGSLQREAATGRSPAAAVDREPRDTELRAGGFRIQKIEKPDRCSDLPQIDQCVSFLAPVYFENNVLPQKEIRKPISAAATKFRICQSLCIIPLQNHSLRR